MSRWQRHETEEGKALRRDKYRRAREAGFGCKESLRLRDNNRNVFEDFLSGKRKVYIELDGSKKKK